LVTSKQSELSEIGIDLTRLIWSASVQRIQRKRKCEPNTLLNILIVILKFDILSKDKAYPIFCEQGDLISVAANIRHWFDMGESPVFKCI